MKNIILASSSKHRKKLLEQLKVKFKTISPDIDESRQKDETVSRYVKRLSLEKAMKIAKKHKNAIVIGSDEVAEVNGKILGKPLTRGTAKKQLKYISNKLVTFKTGLCVIDSQSLEKIVSVTSYKVYIKKLTLDEIDYYIKNEDILNCAASIRIEGLAISLVKKMIGQDPTSIIGLPLIKLTDYLERLNYKVLRK